MSQVHRRNIGCAIIQFCKEAYSPQVIANHYHDGCWPSRIEAAGMDGRLMTRTILLERVWDFRFDPKSSIVETHVSRLRAKVDRPFDVPLIRTERSMGYILDTPEPSPERANGRGPYAGGNKS
jgi:hypothetical protein